ncbi:unnamed protein product [Rotaria magnacalcarata]|uniref:Uncharacterized protein n=1 Tax=Rotaria magnacalcarata TaxID=392030 RepID=A0A8S3F8D7_9BILA|nr:unnamed protein product [Rotaria magnacalcarata]
MLKSKKTKTVTRSLRDTKTTNKDNHDNLRASNTNADDHEFTNCQLSGSYPSFDIEYNNGDSMEQTSVNAAERIKASSRTYTLFNCPILDCSNSPSMVEFIPQSLRKAIQEGKDVCLAHLLIPEEHSLTIPRRNKKFRANLP